MNNPLEVIKNMVTIEDQLSGKVLQIIQKFLIENADQKITMWNGTMLVATLKKEMKDIVDGYSKEEKIKEEKK